MIIKIIHLIFYTLVVAYTWFSLRNSTFISFFDVHIASQSTVIYDANGNVL